MYIPFEWSNYTQTMNEQFADPMTGKQVKIMYTNMYAGKKSTILLQFS